MEAIELTVKGGGEVVAHACGKCRIVARSLDDAERCCVPRKCETCGSEVEPYCRPCSAARLAADETERYVKATKVPAAEYDGDYIFADDVGGGDGGDGYFSDVGALRDAIDGPISYHVDYSRAVVF